MNRSEILAYLTRRLDMANNKKFNQFGDEDIMFIRNYIHLIHNKIFSPQEIVNFMRGSFHWGIQFDQMLNHMIEKFDIKINWIQINPPVQSGFEVYNFKVGSYS